MSDQNYTAALSNVTPVDNAVSAFMDDLFGFTPAAPMTVFDIIGLDKAAVFMALYNAAVVKDQHYTDDLSLEQAHGIVDCCYVCGSWECNTDYSATGRSSSNGFYRGRYMGVDLSGDEVDLSDYDAQNGEGKGSQVMRTLIAALESKDPNVMRQLNKSNSRRR